MKGTLLVNGQENRVYTREETGFGFATADDCLSFHQVNYVLEDETLVVNWGKLKPENVAVITGPEPSASWAKGTIKTTAGNEHQLDYMLSPHTKEQAERVYRERMIEATAQGHAATAQRMAAASAAPIKALSEGLADAAGVARSGLLVADGPLVERMEPDEREFYNRLVQKDPKTGKALSYRALAQRIGCSHSAVKRRREALERKYPELRRFIATGRKELAKGAHPDAIPAAHDAAEDEADR